MNHNRDTNCKIFVGGLNYNTCDDALMGTFSRFGRVTDYVIMKFPESGESRGFGFVTFSCEQEVQCALNSQPIVIDDKKIDLRRAEAPRNDGTKIGGGVRPKNRGDAKFKIFVGGLAYTTPDDMLKQAFSKFGTVQDWIIMKFPETKESRGFGFVTFTSQEEVDSCLSGQPIEVDGKTVDIKKAEPPTPKGEPNLTSKTMRKVFVGSLSYTTSKQELHDYFSEFGDIEDAEVMKFYDTGKSRGFGFVTFRDAESVDNVQSNRPHNINGKDAETRRATPEGKPEDQKGSIKKIMVKGFNDDISDEDVEEYFGKFGKVTKVDQLVWRDSGKKRGYGFVEFEDHDAVDKIALWGSHLIKGNTMDVKKALTEEEMREQKKNEANNSNWGMGNMGNYGYGGGFGGGMNNRGMGNMRNGGMGGNMGGGMGGNMGMGGGMGNMGGMGGNMGNMGGGMGNMGGGMGGNMEGGNMGGGCSGGNACGGGYGQMCGHGQQKPSCAGGNACGGGYGNMCGHGGQGKGGWGEVGSGDGGNKGASGNMAGGGGGNGGGRMGANGGKKSEQTSPPGEDGDKNSGWSYNNYGYGAGAGGGAGGYDMARYAKQLQGGMKGSNGGGGAGGPMRGNQAGSQGSGQTPYQRQGWNY